MRYYLVKIAILLAVVVGLKRVFKISFLHGEFTERLRKTANQMAARFIEDASNSSTQQFVRLAEQIQAITNETRL